MSLRNILANRSSTRAFIDRPVEKSLLNNVLDTAQMSPSNCNVQPWQTIVISGNTKERLKTALLNHILSGNQPAPDFDWNPRYQGTHRDRQFGSANALYSSMGIERFDKQARQKSMLRNWQFFDAPHIILFCMEKYLGIMGAVDVGIYAQTLSLAMSEANISSCMQGALGQFPAPIKEILRLPDELGILFGMSFGYADDKSAVNQTKTERALLTESVTFFE